LGAAVVRLSAPAPTTAASTTGGGASNIPHPPPSGGAGLGASVRSLHQSFSRVDLAATTTSSGGEGGGYDDGSAGMRLSGLRGGGSMGIFAYHASGGGGSSGNLSGGRRAGSQSARGFGTSVSNGTSTYTAPTSARGLSHYNYSRSGGDAYAGPSSARSNQASSIPHPPSMSAGYSTLSTTRVPKPMSEALQEAAARAGGSSSARGPARSSGYGQQQGGGGGGGGGGGTPRAPATARISGNGGSHQQPQVSLAALQKLLERVGSSGMTNEGEGADAAAERLLFSEPTATAASGVARRPSLPPIKNPKDFGGATNHSSRPTSPQGTPREAGRGAFTSSVPPLPSPPGSSRAPAAFIPPLHFTTANGPDLGATVASLTNGGGASFPSAPAGAPRRRHPSLVAAAQQQQNLAAVAHSAAAVLGSGPATYDYYAGGYAQDGDGSSGPLSARQRVALEAQRVALVAAERLSAAPVSPTASPRRR
jgi:hypothetical protein